MDDVALLPDRGCPKNPVIVDLYASMLENLLKQTMEVSHHLQAIARADAYLIAHEVSETIGKLYGIWVWRISTNEP